MKYISKDSWGLIEGVKNDSNLFTDPPTESEVNYAHEFSNALKLCLHRAVWEFDITRRFTFNWHFELESRDQLYREKLEVSIQRDGMGSFIYTSIPVNSEEDEQVEISGRVRPNGIYRLPNALLDSFKIADYRDLNGG